MIRTASSGIESTTTGVGRPNRNKCKFSLTFSLIMITLVFICLFVYLLYFV